jgi:predicted transposase/invertase (TIGR01784 family)
MNEDLGKYINPLTDFEAAEIAKFTPKEREAYEESLKYYRDIKNVVDTSREEGLKEGMEKGMEKGIEQVAKKMKQEGFTKEAIQKLTGLTAEEIDDL